MRVRLIDDQGDPHTGEITRVGVGRFYVRVYGLETTYHRKTGKPYGMRGIYTIHPEDLPAAQQLEVSPPPPRRYGNGRPSHWNV